MIAETCNLHKETIVVFEPRAENRECPFCSVEREFEDAKASLAEIRLENDDLVGEISGLEKEVDSLTIESEELRDQLKELREAEEKP